MMTVPIQSLLQPTLNISYRPRVLLVAVAYPLLGIWILIASRGYLESVFPGKFPPAVDWFFLIILLGGIFTFGKNAFLVARGFLTGVIDIGPAGVVENAKAGNTIKWEDLRAVLIINEQHPAKNAFIRQIIVFQAAFEDPSNIETGIVIKRRAIILHSSALRFDAQQITDIVSAYSPRLPLRH